MSRRRGPGKRGVYFVYGASILLAAPIATGLLGMFWLKPKLDGSWWIVPALLFCVLALVAPVIYFAYIRRLEGRHFKAQRRYHHTLIAASGGMTRIKEIDRLCRLIVYMVNGTVGLTHSGLFLYEPKEERYVLRAVRYASMMPPKLSVPQDDALVKLLQETKDLVVADELHAQIGKGAMDERAKRAQAACAWMRRLEASLIVPSFSDERLLAFLVLGPKRDDEKYTTDDIALFSGLANQAALAIENAMYFEELRSNEAYMIQSEKLASLGQLASGMAHEIHNPLTIISGESQLYLERFKGNDAKVDELLSSIVEECRRAADITRRILRFARPAPTDLAAVDLKEVVDESLSLASYQVRMDRIERSVDVPEGLPKVRSNQNQIQEVLLNLILNAYQAMGDKGGRIAFSATRNGSQVALKIEDNGPGIPSDKLTKVFDPFFTTKATGNGLGLFVSQRIVRSHGGDMEVTSTVGQGTSFIVRLPIWHEQAQAEG